MPKMIYGQPVPGTPNHWAAEYVAPKAGNLAIRAILSLRASANFRDGDNDSVGKVIADALIPGTGPRPIEKYPSAEMWGYVNGVQAYHDYDEKFGDIAWIWQEVRVLSKGEAVKVEVRYKNDQADPIPLPSEAVDHTGFRLFLQFDDDY